MFGIVLLLRNRTPGLIRRSDVACVAVLGILIASTMIGVGFTVRAANVLGWTLGYWSYCFLAASCLLIPSKVARIAALVIAAIPMLMGYVLGTVGVLGLAFILGDYTREPDHTEQIGPGLTCRITEWGMAVGPSGYIVDLYRVLPVPFLKRNVASIRVTDTDPSSRAANCSDVLAVYTRN
jgi:hypothetical protein